MTGDPGLLLRGAVIGFSIAAPVGPIGVLTIRRTLAEGRASGLLTGLGAAAADTVYGAIAALGLTAVTGFLVGQNRWVQLAGGAFLVWLGLRTLFARPAADAARVSGAGLGTAFASTFVLTLTNPLTILSFVGVFAGLGLGTGAGSAGGALAIVAGVFLGSAAWWLLLTALVGIFRDRMDARAMTWVNRLSGGVILAFGIGALVAAVHE